MLDSTVYHGGTACITQATQWGQTAGIAAHSLLPFPFAVLPSAVCGALYAHTVCLACIRALLVSG